ncbi:MAG: hypothetical protein JWQ25_1143 [Daejeonella sp.]|nr:hypothetical protein [Daejeonella sp.]
MSFLGSRLVVSLQLIVFGNVSLGIQDSLLFFGKADWEAFIKGNPALHCKSAWAQFHHTSGFSLRSGLLRGGLWVGKMGLHMG